MRLHQMKITVSNVVIASAVGAVSALSHASAVTCPPIDSSISFFPSNGVIAINPTAQSGDLCTLTLLDSSIGVSTPVARSYDGLDWEVAAGPFSSILSPPICSNTICTFENLPEQISPVKTYVLTSYFHTGFGVDADAARLLEQATFGPTRTSIDALSAISSADKYETWVKDQIAMPLTSHREYYRKR